MQRTTTSTRARRRDRAAGQRSTARRGAGQQVGGGVRRPRRAGLAQDQQLGDHAREAVDLRPARPRSAPRGPVGGRGRLLQPQAQPGQRRAQLVRGVGDEVALRVDHPLHAPGHLVERGADLALLAANPPPVRVRTGRPRPARRAAPASRRSGRTTDAGQQRARGQPERRARSGRPARARASPTARARPTASTLWVMRTAPSARPSRTTGTAVARIALVRASRCRAAPAPDPAAQRARRSPAATSSPRRSSPARSRRRPRPSRSTITTRPRTSRADVATSSSAAAPPADVAATTSACEQRLRLDLGVDAVADGAHQRHEHRPDRQHQHVGQRQHQPRAEGQDAHSAGPVKRKPDAAHGVQPARRGRVVAELAAQPPDVDVERLGGAEPVLVPHPRDQVLAGDDLAGVRDSSTSRSNSLRAQATARRRRGTRAARRARPATARPRGPSRRGAEGFTRRRTARIRAITSAPLNGLTT